MADVSIEFCGEWYEPQGRRRVHHWSRSRSVHRRQPVPAPQVPADRPTTTTCGGWPTSERCFRPPSPIPPAPAGLARARARSFRSSSRPCTSMFSAGPTTYDFTVHVEDDFFRRSTVNGAAGGRPRSPGDFTDATSAADRRPGRGRADAVGAGSRHHPDVLGRGRRPAGWSMTTFNRKLDNVCDKLDKLGVAGLRGGRASSPPTGGRGWSNTR